MGVEAAFHPMLTFVRDMKSAHKRALRSVGHLHSTRRMAIPMLIASYEETAVTCEMQAGVI